MDSKYHVLFDHVRRSLLRLFAVFSFVGTASLPINAETLRVGVILHLTGDLAMQSQAFREGIELAAEQANRTSKDAVTLFFEDGKNSAPASYSAAKKLLATDTIDAALISSYLDAKTDAALFESARIPAVVLWDASPEIDALGEYVFSIGPWIPSSGKAAADFSRDHLKAKRAGILLSEDPFSESAAESFRERFERFGRKIVFTERLGNHPDYRSSITKLKGQDLDVLYSPVVSNIVPFYMQLRQLGVKVPAISCNVITPEHIKNNSEIFEGIYHTMVEDPSGERFKRLTALYEQKFHAPLTLPWYVATGFDALNLVMHARNQSDGTGPGMKDALLRTKDFAGVSQTFTINPGGSSPVHEKVFVIRDGMYVPAG